MKKIILFILSAVWFGISECTDCPGCVSLDEYSLDKLIDRFSFSVVKFDSAYPYGDKHDAFSALAKDLTEVKDVLVGQVGIKDYGDKLNLELGKKYGVESKEDYPKIILFKTEFSGKHREKFVYEPDEEFSVESLKNFVKKNTGIYVPLPGCIKEFDDLALKFCESFEKGSSVVTDDVILETETAAKNAKESKLQAETYVRLMRKIMAEGIEFIPKEKARVKKIMGTNLSKDKITDLQSRINILASFEKLIPNHDKKKNKKDQKEEL